MLAKLCTYEAADINYQRDCYQRSKRVLILVFQTLVDMRDIGSWRFVLPRSHCSVPSNGVMNQGWPCAVQFSAQTIGGNDFWRDKSQNNHDIGRIFSFLAFCVAYPRRGEQ